MKYIIIMLSAFLMITSNSYAQSVSKKAIKAEKQIAEQNKSIVKRFNTEFIESGNMNTFNELMADDFVNYTAPVGSPTDKSGIVYFFNSILRPAFSNIKVEIHEMMVDGDKVITRKTLSAVHTGDFFGVEATNKTIALEVIDIIQLRDGKYIGHWGILDMYGLMAQLQQ